MATKRSSRSSRTGRSSRRSSNGECVVPPPVPLEVLPQFTLNTPAHKERGIREYVESQAKDEKVKHAERVATESIFGRRHEVWDVHTDKTRWWVITQPMNLYSQALFPSMDYTLSFHVGLMARVEAAERGPGLGTTRDRLAPAWRPWMQAADALDEADEAEEFQAVGMRCRESLVQGVRSLANEKMVKAGEESPKKADFIGWAEVLADKFAGGTSAERVRGYLKALAREAWQLVNWVTHASNAARPDAALALSATEAVLVAFGTASLRNESGRPTRCPRCRSYALIPDETDDGRSALVCESCGLRGELEAGAAVPKSSSPGEP